MVRDRPESCEACDALQKPTHNKPGILFDRNCPKKRPTHAVTTCRAVPGMCANQVWTGQSAIYAKGTHYFLSFLRVLP